MFKYFFVVLGYIIFMSDMLHELGFFCALFSWIEFLQQKRGEAPILLLSALDFGIESYRSEAQACGWIFPQYPFTPIYLST